MSNGKGSCDNNEVSSCSEQGFYIANGSNVTAYSNYVHDNTKCAFMVSEKSSANIYENSIRKNGSLDLYVRSSNGITFKNNGSDKCSTKAESGSSASVSGLKNCLRNASFSTDSSKTYTGSQIKPAVQTSLSSSTDFTVAYGTNKDTGEGTVKITGKGNYAGSFVMRFDIVPAKATLSSLSSGTDSITASYKADSQCTGYEISYSKNSDFSGAKTKRIPDKSISSCKITGLEVNNKYYVRIRGYKNFNGKDHAGVWSDTKSISTQLTDFTKATVYGITDMLYSGTAQTQVISVRLDNATLRYLTDYTVAYQNNTNVGTATVKITGKGLYSGTITKTFNIIKVSDSVGTLTTAKVSNPIAQTYSGMPVTPIISVIADGKKLLKNRDFTVSYANNAAIGTGYAVVKGKGNFTGTVIKNFTISQRKTNTLKSPKIIGRQTTPYAAVVAWVPDFTTNGAEVMYSYDKNFTSPKTLSAEEYGLNLLAINSLKGDKNNGYDNTQKIYVKIRTFIYVAGEKSYSEWSDVREIKAYE